MRDGIGGLQSVVLYSLPELDGAIDTGTCLCGCGVAGRGGCPQLGSKDHPSLPPHTWGICHPNPSPPRGLPTTPSHPATSPRSLPFFYAVPLGGLVGDNIYLVPERVKRLASRLHKWVALRRTPPRVRGAAGVGGLASECASFCSCTSGSSSVRAETAASNENTCHVMDRWPSSLPRPYLTPPSRTPPIIPHSIQLKPTCSLHHHPQERKVAVLVYGFPPGVGATGTAALLNVPKSLEHVLATLQRVGAWELIKLHLLGSPGGICLATQT